MTVITEPCKRDQTRQAFPILQLSIWLKWKKTKPLFMNERGFKENNTSEHFGT